MRCRRESRRKQARFPRGESGRQRAVSALIAVTTAFRAGRFNRSGTLFAYNKNDVERGAMAGQDLGMHSVG